MNDFFKEGDVVKVVVQREFLNAWWAPILNNQIGVVKEVDKTKCKVAFSKSCLHEFYSGLNTVSDLETITLSCSHFRKVDFNIDGNQMLDWINL